jgi:superfamily II DNA/RNA helicase
MLLYCCVVPCVFKYSGKRDFEEEQVRVSRMNILVATPGRLLQHLEQTPGFDAAQLQVNLQHCT